jgi:ABC-2 type transport system permease protein
MNSLRRIVAAELRLLLRTAPLPIVCGSLFLAGLLALWTGQRRVDRFEAELAGLPAQYETQQEVVARQFSPDGEAGYVAYYTFFPTHHPLPPLAPLSAGVRETTPGVLWVRLLGLEGQLYDGILANPVLQSLGDFDLAFVLTVLAPLALLVLGHDVLTRDREQGRLALVLAQGASPASLVTVRLALRFAAVAATTLGLCAAGFVWFAVVPDADALLWVASSLLHLVLWAGVTAVIAVAARSVVVGLAAALTTWVATVVLLPALFNLVVLALHPVPEGLEITVRQRQESHGSWDKPRAEIMEPYLELYPQWKDTPPVEGRFAWRWYYAMHELADRSVADAAQRYRDNLHARQAHLARLLWFAPTAYAQLLLNHHAGTDLDAHLAYLAQVRAFHQRLRDHFHPLAFAETRITPAQYADFPRFVPARPVGDAHVSLAPLGLGAAAMLFVSMLLLRRNPLP